MLIQCTKGHRLFIQRRFINSNPLVNERPQLAGTVINRIAPRGAHRDSRRGHNTIVLQHTHTHTHTLSLSLTLSHTHTHTHTHTLSLSLSLSLSHSRVFHSLVKAQHVTVAHPCGDHARSCLTWAFESECSCSVPLALSFISPLLFLRAASLWCGAAESEIPAWLMRESPERKSEFG